ncbi:MAG TPA: DUF1269 domain-containing protein [Gaiellaceae bacterium]|nr:DUF1269 domain-containing protein [Gaiellaceae bacterium]
MATLTVWKFDSAAGAEDALARLEDLQRQELIEIEDAAYVTWADDAGKPKTHQLTSLTGAGALGGAFWGLLFGLIFFVPFLGAAVGAAIGGLSGSLTDVGIDDSFIKEVREEVTPGTSALFLLSDNAVLDRVRESLSDLAGHAKLIHTNMTNEQEATLREAFSENAEVK